jgi:U3 small nucleolar RNA-associated protein 20
MGEEKFEQHLKQIVANINYEYLEGRMSAINLLASVLEKLPEQLLEKHAQLLFLPLVLQLVNDDSKECREGVSRCLVLLLTRSSTEVLNFYHDYIVRWSKSLGPLRIASLQVFGIVVGSCAGFLKGAGLVSSTWIPGLQALLKEEATTQSEWEVAYFSLICVEKLSQRFESDLMMEKDQPLWTSIVECLVNSHPWIKLASSRIILQNLLTTSGKEDGLFLENNPGMLFEITRNLCFQMNVNEEEQTDELSELAIKSLTLALPIMQEHPELCFSTDTEETERSDPVAWLMKRLSQIARPKGPKRRCAVFKCFAAFVTLHASLVAPHLELMLEPLHRSSLEASNEVEKESFPSYNRHDSSGAAAAQEDIPSTSETSLARDVLQLLEDTAASPEVFLMAYATIKTRARDKKAHRKLEAKLEAVNDPKAAAQRKIKKQEHEKQRKKRRVEERRHGRGAVKKGRHDFK